jgi:hypothetical protein
MMAALLGGLLLLGVIAGCGGSDEPGVADVTATVSPEPSALVELDRYHYSATLLVTGRRPDGAANNFGVTTEGDFQAPDRHSFTYTTQIAGATVRLSAVVIGERIWLRNGDDPWQETSPNDPEALRLLGVTFSPINAGFLGGPSFRQARAAVQRLPSTLEFANEVRAYHYAVGAAGAQYFDQLLVPEPDTLQLQNMSWDVWLAQEGAWPVRLQATGTVTNDIPILQDLDLVPPTDWTLLVNVSRPNDPELSVQAPQ